MLQHDQEVRDALEELELSLGTPLVPGEMESWIQSLEAALGATGDVLQRQIAVTHKQQYAEILEQDPGLQPRIDQLQTADEQTLRMLNALRERVEGIAPQVAAHEPDERRVETGLQQIADQGLELVVHARRQETAVTTWFTESFNRDRGTVD
jgi:hypothetical protein